MKQKPRESIDRPTAIKLIIGGVVLLGVGAFLGRTAWNEHKLLADIPMSPLMAEEDEIATEPIPEEEVIDHCAKSAGNTICKLGLPTIDTPNMKLVSVGTETKNGSKFIASPGGLFIAGWYNGSVAPGMSGITFINAHSSNRNPAPFNRLQELQKGDEVTIERGDGTVFTYRVSEVSRLSLDDANTWVKSNLGSADDLKRQNGKNVLYLMTCVGSWNLAEGTMNERVLVRADLL
jgi:LPXTG-site transpeptidase (sortase) family protein